MISKATHPEEFSKHITEVQAKYRREWQQTSNPSIYGLPRTVSTDCSLAGYVRLLRSCNSGSSVLS